MSSPFENLIIFEVANNHMGDVEHGKKLIEAFGAVAKDFPVLTQKVSIHDGPSPSVLSEFHRRCFLLLFSFLENGFEIVEVPQCVEKCDNRHGNAEPHMEFQQGDVALGTIAVMDEDGQQQS